MTWIDRLTAAVAQTAGLEATDLQLTTELSREILDLARVASHSSGDRINAPLLCYALGIAVGRGAALNELAATVRAESDKHA